MPCFLSAVMWLVKWKVLVRSRSRVGLARGHGRQHVGFSTEHLHYNIQRKAGRVRTRIPHQTQFRTTEQKGESSLRGRDRCRSTGSSSRYRLHFPLHSATLTVTGLISSSVPRSSSAFTFCSTLTIFFISEHVNINCSCFIKSLTTNC